MEVNAGNTLHDFYGDFCPDLQSGVEHLLQSDDLITYCCKRSKSLQVYDAFFLSVQIAVQFILALTCFAVLVQQLIIFCVYVSFLIAEL